ncbi:hypothetical protein FEK48_01280 [Escherichia sp. E2593]|nr:MULTISPECIES: hypothetical protein [unclassified Escherichia]QLN20403.1 hypothetical protein HVZ29_16895 [Escherichia coli]QCT86509.1 hypothetical protein FEM44_04305 [Escherichia sp. E4742]QML57545.1 hypothetical protein HVX32_16730 [Escherichia coli]RZM93988.1 hypothetical protein D9740_15920 [Escherichia sp. E14V5]RZN06995.1 hypothetical protein D9741_02245 [Escherichia sp. E14V7]
MNLLIRTIFSLLLLLMISIPVISDCVAMAIESRFKYMMLLF